MRGKWEIILDILKILEEKNQCKKTRLMQSAYLDWRSFKKYFKFLKENNYIKPLETNNSNTKDFTITENGKNLLNELKDVKKLLKNDKPIDNYHN